MKKLCALLSVLVCMVVTVTHAAVEDSSKIHSFLEEAKKYKPVFVQLVGSVVLPSVMKISMEKFNRDTYAYLSPSQKNLLVLTVAASTGAATVRNVREFEKNEKKEKYFIVSQVAILAFAWCGLSLAKQ